MASKKYEEKVLRGIEESEREIFLAESKEFAQEVVKFFAEKQKKLEQDDFELSVDTAIRECTMALYTFWRFRDANAGGLISADIYSMIEHLSENIHDYYFTLSNLVQAVQQTNPIPMIYFHKILSATLSTKYVVEQACHKFSFPYLDQLNKNENKHMSFGEVAAMDVLYNGFTAYIKYPLMDVIEAMYIKAGQASVDESDYFRTSEMWQVDILLKKVEKTTQRMLDIIDFTLDIIKKEVY